MLSFSALDSTLPARPLQELRRVRGGDGERRLRLQHLQVRHQLRLLLLQLQLRQRRDGAYYIVAGQRLNKILIGN